MYELFFGHVLTRFQVLFLLLLAGIVGGMSCWFWHKHWQNELAKSRDEILRLEKERDETQKRPPTGPSQTERARKLRAVRHNDLLTGLDFISKKSAETIKGLGEEQIVMREKQELIFAKAQELYQSTRNALDLSDRKDPTSKPLLNVKSVIEDVLRELKPYADIKEVTLSADLADLEPVFLYRELAKQAIRNVIHNAIKYSFPRGVVKTTLNLQIGVLQGVEKAICIDVKDTGKGIQADQHDSIFGYEEQGNDITEPGYGLGLFLARDAARRQGGDVVLVRSSLNQGSVFRILLPYGMSEDRRQL